MLFNINFASKYQHLKVVKFEGKLKAGRTRQLNRKLKPYVCCHNVLKNYLSLLWHNLIFELKFNLIDCLASEYVDRICRDLTSSWVTERDRHVRYYIPFILFNIIFFTAESKLTLIVRKVYAATKNKHKTVIMADSEVPPALCHCAFWMADIELLIGWSIYETKLVTVIGKKWFHIALGVIKASKQQHILQIKKDVARALQKLMWHRNFMKYPIRFILLHSFAQKFYWALLFR